jgi:mannose-6-phosphate isomerase-like protein (cupin superfamily)
MLVKRFADAKAYEAPNHRAVRSLRLQGFEAEGPKGFWTGLSHFLPGGGAGPDASPLEKVYVILAGELTVIVDGKETVLAAMDSCSIPGGESREIVNRGNTVCTMLVVMPYPPGGAS